ncbi:uncharacterized protein LOC111404731 [Olea europaea var. sylvestris]|uniref:uncharacterized protein LOC111404731 n=1 Tax=Olea europaea var. sylvestris TaxID=158386 RepID=UPI000C1CF4B3|nr:uncharacterized protein LOC111404731 [Olea europaea var. sylvestris]
MVVKSKKVEHNISDHEEVFTLQKYRMKLNLEKCVFGVASKKILGFMITHRRIEQTLIRSRPWQQWNHLGLRKRFKSFSGAKQTLDSPPTLTKPESGDTLFLYLTVSQNAVSNFLVKEVNRAQDKVHFGRTACPCPNSGSTKVSAIFSVSSHCDATNQPQKHILQRPDISGRLLKWATEVGEFDIEFKPRPSIKAQALADFIAELTPRPGGPDDIQCVLRFEFKATNNEAEYEAVIIAIELSINLKLESIKIFSDSKLVVGQIDGTFEKKDEKMSLYCLKVFDFRWKLKSCEILKMARADKCKVDALSRLVFIGVDGLDKTVHVRVVAEPSINPTIGVMDFDHEPSWMEPIVDFITNDGPNCGFHNK